MKAEPAATPRLVRALGPWMATAIVVGTIIGSGVFKKPQEVAQHVPFFGLAALVWILGGVLALLGSLALAEVAVLYPQAGGNYVYLREGFGRLAGFLWGWVDFWIIRAGSLAALATVFAESLHDILRNRAFRQLFGQEPVADVLADWQLRSLTIAVLLVLAAVNIRGVRWGGGLQLFITLVKVGSLVVILLLPWTAIGLVSANHQPPWPSMANLQPIWPDLIDSALFQGFGVALVGVLFAYHGWMNLAPVAGEVHNPQHNLPLAILGGTALVMLLYLGVNLAYAVIMPAAEMAACTTTPVATAFSQHLLGPMGAVFASAAVMCSVFGALNGNLLVGPRLVYAMAEDRLAPRMVSGVHPNYHTPAAAIAVLAGWTAILVLAAPLVSEPHKPIFNMLTAYAMFGATIFETLAVATIFIFRRRYPDTQRPYRCWGYPWVPLGYSFIMILVVLSMFISQTREALLGVAFIALGAVVFWLIERKPAPAA